MSNAYTDTSVTGGSVRKADQTEDVAIADRLIANADQTADILPAQEYPWQASDSGTDHENCTKWVIALRDLGDDAYELKAPLDIVIEEYHDEDNVVARQPELEAFGEGEDEMMAIQALRCDIIRLYEDLVDIEPCELGPLPRSWQRILKKIITRA
jgi:hypothetical protein